jgi:hypothetical protein
MYRAWLGSAGKKPRGADARGLMHELLDDSDVWVRRDAVELLLLSDRTLWPQVNDIRRIIAIEDDDETRERLEKLLASDRPGR